MPLPLLIAIAFAQGQTNPPTSHTLLVPVKQTAPSTTATQTPAQQPVATQPAQQPFSAPFAIAEPNRIALTPKIDGKLDEEEWDPLATTPDMKTFFQWEPGKLYLAAVVPNGHDVLASFDLHANGWLIGKDNLEVRVTNGPIKPTITARLMDGTGVQGPKWIDLPGFSLSSSVAATSDGTNTTFEIRIADVGLGILPTDPGTKMLMRIDDPLSTDPPSPAYLPRTLSPVTLVMARAAALPPGLRFNPEMIGRSSVAGEGTRIRLGFNGTNAMKLQRIALRSEGFSRNDTDEHTLVFPKFDDRGRSYVDYGTDIKEGSPEGYRVLRGTLTTADGVSAMVQGSYRVGPIIDFDIPRQTLAVATMDRSIRIPFYIKSNSSKRVSGEVNIVVPEPLKVLNGNEHKISIFSNRGADRQTFDLFLPPNASGTYPIKFAAMVNGKKIEQIEYLTIGGP